jgi:hypothetical protein
MRIEGEFTRTVTDGRGAYDTLAYWVSADVVWIDGDEYQAVNVWVEDPDALLDGYRGFDHGELEQALDELIDMRRQVDLGKAVAP